MSNIKFIVIDLFAGAGGTSVGIESSGVAKVIAAVNHDPVAIASHTANHPDVTHFVEDIRTLNIAQLRDIAARYRAQYPAAKLVVWASPDCTHFSRAKSGPKNRDTRTLAECLDRYVDGLQADYLLVENVEEFTSWGPLDDNGKPISRHEGRDYLAWVRSICALGYEYDYRILNAADFGAHQTRRRYFGQFWRIGTAEPAWPESTHVDKKKMISGLFQDDRKPWRPVREVLNMDDWGRSIFARQKPLVDRTLRRIINGIKKFGDQQQVMTCNTPGYCKPADKPSDTITAAGHKALVTPFTIQYYGTGDAASVDEPNGTVTTRDRNGLVTVQFIDHNYSANTTGQSVDAPCWAVTGSPKAAVMTAWIIDPAYGNVGRSIDNPAVTVVASQGSNPLTLAVATHGDSAHWQPQPGDTATMLELKTLMRQKNIGDVYMRMLYAWELALIQGFPVGYQFSGTTRHVKKQIGNAVHSAISKHWFQALAQKSAI